MAIELRIAGSTMSAAKIRWSHICSRNVIDDSTLKVSSITENSLFVRNVS